MSEPSPVTADTVPAEILALVDEAAGRVHRPGGTVAAAVAEVINAWEAYRRGGSVDDVRRAAPGAPVEMAEHVPLTTCTECGQRLRKWPCGCWVDQHCARRCLSGKPHSPAGDVQPELCPG